MHQFTKTGETATLRSGEDFEISLPENPSTGFRWKIASNGEPASKMASDEFRPAAAVGGQGIHNWQFRAVQPGESAIQMELGRPSNAPAEPARVFAVKVIVTS